MQHVHADPYSGSAYGHYDTVPNTVRDGAGFDFGTEYDSLLRNRTYNTLYSIRLAEERHILQDAVLGRSSDLEALLPRLRMKQGQTRTYGQQDFDLHTNQGSEYAPGINSLAPTKFLGPI